MTTIIMMKLIASPRPTDKMSQHRARALRRRMRVDARFVLRSAATARCRDRGARHPRANAARQPHRLDRRATWRSGTHHEGMDATACNSRHDPRDRRMLRPVANLEPRVPDRRAASRGIGGPDPGRSKPGEEAQRSSESDGEEVSHGPETAGLGMVGATGIEPVTPTMST